jgi:putative spermidine/putrescine transport system substrate-binding protein
VTAQRLTAATIALAAVLMLAAAGCGGGGDDDDPQRDTRTAQVRPPRPMEPLARLGAGEGRLDLVAWAGYVEDGSTDPDADWVTGYERATGCDVRVKLAGTSDEMVELMRTGRYDGVSASGDATLRLIAHGDVAPVNTDLVPNYADVYDGLKRRRHNSVDGQMFGVPQGRGANVLMWDEDAVDPPPDSWRIVWEPGPEHAGKVTVYDSPITIADAALYLKATKPELAIDDVYALDEKQFQAAIDLLEKQRPEVGTYWRDYTQQEAAVNRGAAVVGASWQSIAQVINAGGEASVQTTLPEEGATGWSDTWMVHSSAKHPNCMYRWMNHVLDPRVNAEIAEYFGQAPSNRKACAATARRGHCDAYHADDEAYYDRVAYWTTPTRECGDERGSVCRDWAAWVRAWRQLRR